jgi:hypothetical protein
MVGPVVGLTALASFQRQCKRARLQWCFWGERISTVSRKLDRGG